MATEPPTSTTTTEKRHRSAFDLSSDFFHHCRFLSFSATSAYQNHDSFEDSPAETLEEINDDEEDVHSINGAALTHWTCNTCKTEFESLQDQRSHFKSDVHRFNVKLTIAGKEIVKEEDFDELTSDSLKDYDVSSISGSEDEADKLSRRHDNMHGESLQSVRNKLFIHLQSGERVSIWKCLLLNESESISAEIENDKSFSIDRGGCLRESEVIERLKSLTHEPRDSTHFRVVLLAKGGHFAGCVFDGNSVVAQKTFHRYVVRAKAGKKQSSKDASGKSANSAGAALRRYNELALKKDVQELLASWKSYFDASICVFIHAPSTNRQLIFNDKSCFGHQRCAIRNVPLVIRRPTLKEAQRVYKQLTQVAYELDENKESMSPNENVSTNSIGNGDPSVSNEDSADKFVLKEAFESCKTSCEQYISSEGESDLTGRTTDLHVAALSSNPQKVFELLEQGVDPCIKDERGHTPYTLASDKEVRNMFRRFMASNPDKWDWHAAKVPSALTKEMEESQAAKQAEKDAKRKARAKELKKLRKAREKKAVQAQAAENDPVVTDTQSMQSPILKREARLHGSHISKEEELRRAQAAEREKRAAAAERRLAAAAALKANSSHAVPAPSTLLPKTGLATDVNCSCCSASLAGKVPFHRYNYKYCSTSCMHVHREILEDE